MLDLIRMSMLRNVPVILGERQIGLFQSACFDQTRKRVCALIVSGGIRGKWIVYAQHVRMTTNSFILVDSCLKCRQSDKQQTSLFVRDTSGLLVGRVTDYALDEGSLDVLGIEIVLGYLPCENHKQVWVFEYNTDAKSKELSIPMFLCSEPCFSEEGNNACEYPQ